MLLKKNYLKIFALPFDGLTQRKKKLRQAAKFLNHDYKSDGELTAFTSFDNEDFVE